MPHQMRYGCSVLYAPVVNSDERTYQRMVNHAAKGQLLT